ncbi:MAG: hypothetical protein H6626_09255 [Pseudobdellovibrionaceae bacterium]|nr:hypothetical protein [Bdellovibrionales bacterium]USN46403.1 MAG: hypothetical protein H6626_09255 [Pseudobdellovibrionaceae bacterium]
MIVECPRCGFSQPKDRYCANCGVDMDNYKPEPKPWHKKLVGSMVFQIFLAVWAVAAMVFFIFQGQQDQFNNELQRAQQLGEADTSNEMTVDEKPTSKSTSAPTQNQGRTNNKAAISKPTAPTETKPPRDSEDDELAKEYADYDFDQPAKTKAVVDEEPESVDEDGSNIKSISPSGLFESEDTLKSIDAPTEVTVRFAEVSANFISTLASQGEVLTDAGGFKVFSVAHQGPLGALLDRDPGSRFLGRDHSQGFGSSGIELSYVSQEDGDYLGLTFQVKPTFENKQVTVKLQGQVNLKYEDPRSTNPAPISGRYTFQPGRVLVISGILPHEAVAPSLLDALGGTPISAMGSVDFKSRASDVIMLVHPY